MWSVAAFFVWCYAAPNGWSSPRRRANSRARPVPRAAWPWLAVLAPVMSIAVLSMWMLLGALGVASDRTLPDEIIRYGERPGGVVVLGILLTGLIPLLEEFSFRGWVQRPLERRFGAVPAITTTALLFAAAHMDARGLPIFAAGGVALGYTAWATRSVWSSFVLHLAWNAGVLLFNGFLPTFDPAPHGRALALPAALAFAACAGVFLWVAPKLRAAGRSGHVDRAGRTA
jgi:membrane protease YdiL (CAAX protease family)